MVFLEDGVFASQKAMGLIAIKDKQGSAGLWHAYGQVSKEHIGVSVIEAERPEQSVAPRLALSVEVRLGAAH